MILDFNKTKIYFGSEEDQIFSKNPDENFQNLKKKLNLKELIFAHQVHGVDALVLSDNKNHLISSNDNGYKKEEIKEYLNIFSHTADIIISNKPGAGIGVLTADCLPIVIVDKKRNVISAVHAGWRSSVQDAVVHAISIMMYEFESQKKDLKIYFGPCARSCCYEVGEDFVNNLKDEKSVVRENNKFFFDLVRFNKNQLYDFGIKKDQIIDDNCRCTMCDKSFCSYRRDKTKQWQASIVFFS